MKAKKYFSYLIALILLVFTGCIQQNPVDIDTNNQVIEEKIDQESNKLDEDGAYYSMEDVSEYLIEYKKLPKNYLTKKEARDLGWEPREGNLWEVTDKGVIGGDFFGNFERQLPEGDYKEADVNYQGGRRGAERLVYDEDINVYYTKDHYKTFERINP